MFLDNDDKKIRVAFYIRVSTDEQVKGFGIDMQKSSIEDLFAFKEKQANWIYQKEHVFIDEGYSGGDLDRPKFKKMLECIKNKEVDLIVVYKIDRISRNLTHLLNVFQEFQKHNVAIYSIKENIDFSSSIGRLAFHIFGALAEFERETIKTRTLDGIIASAKQGNYAGGNIPLGYKKVENPNKKGSKLEIVQEEAKIIKQLFDWFVFDRKNYEQIRDIFNELKISKGISYKGKNPKAQWHENTIKGMLSNTIYAGIRYKKVKKENCNEEIIETKCPAIIDDIVFKQAQYYIEETSITKGKKGGGYNTYLLSRKLMYKDSGAGFVGYQRTKGGFAYRHKKIIKNNTEYPNIEIAADVIENFVWDRILEVIKNPKKFFEIYEKQNEKTKELSRLEDELQDFKNKSSLEEEKIIKISTDYYDGKISEEMRQNLTEVCNEKIIAYSKLMNEIDDNIKKIVYIKVTKKKIEKFKEAHKANLQKITQETKQSLVDSLVESIIVWKEGENIKARINFRFAKNFNEEDEELDEPLFSQNKTKKTGSPKTSCSNGGQ